MPDREERTERTNKEKADGAREDVNLGSATTSRMERGAGQPSQPDKPLPKPTEKPGRAGGQTGRQPVGDEAGGITNGPPPEERHEEDELPPRGEGGSSR